MYISDDHPKTSVLPRFKCVEFRILFHQCFNDCGIIRAFQGLDSNLIVWQGFYQIFSGAMSLSSSVSGLMLRTLEINIGGGLGCTRPSVVSSVVSSASGVNRLLVCSCYPSQ